MVIEIAAGFAGAPVLVVTDSRFGNNGLFKPVRQALGLQFHLIGDGQPCTRTPRQLLHAMLYLLRPCGRCRTPCANPHTPHKQNADPVPR